ncbi:MAG: CAAX prenyl protease-related protein [Planctomycetales bacterium]|nr:CAAX prenyl protease-related protein [Planctomycetales bacterium]
MGKLFIVPMVLYLLGTTIIGRLDTGYPIGYACVVCIIAIVISWLWLQAEKSDRECVRFHWRVLPGVVIGLIGIALWIVLCNLGVEQAVAQYLPKFMRPEARVGYNPFEALPNTGAVVAFIAVRLFGIAIIVPIAEELFWRGFLLRWLIDPEWERVGIGDYTFSSCAIVTAMFTLAHPEWLAAATYCLLINGLLYWKRDLWQCIVAHAVSNAALVAYVLYAGAWELW